MFHEMLPDGNSNKISPDLRGIVLQSQIFGRARDLCMGIKTEIIASAAVQSAIVDALYKRYALSVVSDVLDNINQLLTTRRGPNESLKNFELRFATSVAKFNGNGESVKLNPSLTALTLLENACVDYSQRISILSATAPHR